MVKADRQFAQGLESPSNPIRELYQPTGVAARNVLGEDDGELVPG